jgi:hypothetical protein
MTMTSPLCWLEDVAWAMESIGMEMDNTSAKLNANGNNHRHSLRGTCFERQSISIVEIISRDAALIHVKTL